MAKKSFGAGATKPGILNTDGGEKLKEMQAKIQYNFNYIPKEKIVSNPKNEMYTQDGIEALKESILINGLRHNLSVLYNPDNDTYRLVSGERRYHAITSMSDKEYNDLFPAGIPCKVEKSEITEVKEITDETVKVEDEDALKDAEKALEEALKDYDGNYTESEREELEKQLENVKDALTAIDNAKKATEEIEQLPNVDDLKHSDKESVDRVKEIYDNLTENEKSMLEEDTRSKMSSLVKQMEELEKISYAPSIIEGAGQIWKAGSDTNAKFRSNAEFEEFVKVLVDGKVLDASKYTVSAGSTVVELKADYLNTLSAGEHTLSIVSENGTASTMFTIEKKAALDNAKNTSVNSPKTGDSNGFIWWFVVLFAGVGMMIITLAVHEKKKRSMK